MQRAVDHSHAPGEAFGRLGQVRLEVLERLHDRTFESGDGLGDDRLAHEQQLGDHLLSNIVLEVHQGRLQALRQCQTARASGPFVPGDESLDTPKKLPELNLAHPDSTIGAHRPLRRMKDP
jgi:hypothetical protein